MEWSWKVFLIAWPIAVIISMFSRGAMNAQNVARFGEAADYHNRPTSSLLIGSMMAGAIYAAIATVVIGFF